MINLELLDENNEKLLLEIQRDDIPMYFAEDASYTIDVSKYGKIPQKTREITKCQME